MPLSPTSEAIKSTLQKINSLGIYTYTIFQWLSPAFGRILFGEEQFGISKKSNINVRDILVDTTTSEDGRTVSWRNVSQNFITTTADGAVTAATALVLDDITWFSKWDSIKIRTAAWDLIRYVTDINTGAKTLTLNAAITCADNDPVARLSYSKTKWAVIDRLDYDVTTNRYDNYFQNFGAKLSLTLDQINSHYEINAMSGMPNPTAASKTKLVMESAIKEFIRNKVAQKIGIEIIWDIARQFYDGEKALIGWRHYAAGLRDIIGTPVSISSADSDEEKFEKIWQTVYKVKNRSFQAGNKKVAMVGNDKFVQEFSTLAASKVQFTDMTDTYGYNLTYVKLPWGLWNVEMLYEPQLDVLEFVDNSVYEQAVCYVLPLDLISGKARKWMDVDNIKEATMEQWGFDVKILRSNTDHDTWDTFTFLFFYWMTFVFWGNDLDIYKKIVIA